MWVVIILLLLMSGDVEMNPGPVGECTLLINGRCEVLEPEIYSHLPNLLVTLL